jgi:Protein of unknown function (DUF2808)
MPRSYRYLPAIFRVLLLPILAIFAAISVQAITLRDGVTYFLKPPQLLSSTTSQDGSFLWGASYYFTLRVPEGADESLQKVVIEQQEGLGRPQFNAKDTEAFEGTRKNQGKSIPMKLSETSRDPITLIATFDPPIKPGTTITIRLFPVRNPEVGGTYLYGITAFPKGEKSHGQFLGFGRIRIYDRNND